MLIPYNARTPSEQPPMILSKLHKFLFLKGRKVAGTSVEVFLSGICGPEDVITPITPIDENIELTPDTDTPKTMVPTLESWLITYQVSHKQQLTTSQATTSPHLAGDSKAI